MVRNTFSFALGVERAHRLVHQQQTRIGQERTRNAEPLALATGELDALVADNGVEAFGPGGNEIIGVRPARRALDFGRRRIWLDQREIVADRGVKQDRFLRHIADGAAPGAQRCAGELMIAEADRTRAGIDQAEQRVHKRRLAGAGAADDRKHTRDRQRQIDLIEHSALAEPDLQVAD